jgi:hypothetical protein
MSSVKERPILFGGPMVRALLAGSKTQTRRAVKSPTGYFQVNSTLDGQVVGVEVVDTDENYVRGLLCPYGQPGDRLWVRETFYAFGYWQKRLKEDKPAETEWHFVDLTQVQEYSYRFEKPSENVGKRRSDGGKPQWWKRPSIFMPRAASRLLLEITAVRVERVQAISEADAVAEGVEVVDGILEDSPGFRNYMMPGEENAFGFPRNSFGSLWRSINGTESWAANPWVWVVEFKVIDGKEVASA